MADQPLHEITIIHKPDTWKKFDFSKKNQEFILEKTQLDLNIIRPDKNVSDHQKSKNMSILKKSFPESCQMPLEDNALHRLMVLKGKLFANEKKLGFSRERQKKAKELISKEWSKLEAMELDFREQFVFFNNFVRENHDKRFRMNKRLLENRRIATERQAEIEKLNGEAQQMLKAQTYMESNIRRHDEQKAYLNRVMERCQTFTSISDIVTRYDDLINAKSYLLCQQKNALEILENAKLVMMKLIEDKNFIIMGLNNQIANLQARYENANIKALESEELVTQIKNNAVKQLNEIDTVKNSIWNLYVHMASSKKHPIKIKKENVEEQMMYVNRTLTELNKVNKLIKKRAAKLNSGIKQ